MRRKFSPVRILPRHRRRSCAAIIVVQRTVVGYRTLIEGCFRCLCGGARSNHGHCCVGNIRSFRQRSDEAGLADDIALEGLCAGIVFGFHGIAASKAAFTGSACSAGGTILSFSVDASA